VQLQASGDISNLGGTLQADSYLGLLAQGNITAQTTTRSTCAQQAQGSAASGWLGRLDQAQGPLIGYTTQLVEDENGGHEVQVPVYGPPPMLQNTRVRVHQRQTSKPYRRVD
jgi:hypothetical protein